MTRIKLVIDTSSDSVEEAINNLNILEVIIDDLGHLIVPNLAKEGKHDNPQQERPKDSIS